MKFYKLIIIKSNYLKKNDKNFIIFTWNKEIMSENNDSKIINEFYLSPLDCLLINHKISERYKLVPINNTDTIKTIIKKKRKKFRKINKKGIYLEKFKILFNKIHKLSETQLKGILNLIDVKKEGIEQNGFFELDISKLDKESFKKLKHYVENC